MKNLFNLMISIVLLVTPLAEAHAAGSVSKAYVTVTAPKVGEKPIMKGTVPSSASTMVTKVVWSGELDENGCFKAGESYTVKIYLSMKSGMDKVFRNHQASEWKINGKWATFKEVASSSGRKCTLEYTFGRIGMGSRIITSGDFTIAPPVPGQKPAATATVNNPDIEIKDIKWDGFFDENGNFKSHEQYGASIYISVRQGCLGSFNMLDKNNNFTVNGKKVRVLQKGSRTDMMVAWKGYTESSLDYVDMSRLYTLEQADKLHKSYKPLTLNIGKLYMEAMEEIGRESTSTNGVIDNFGVNKLSPLERISVEKVIVNIPDRVSYEFMLQGLPNVKEVWFDENSEPAYILAALVNDAMKAGHSNSNSNPYYYGSQGGTTRDLAIYLPASKYPKGLVSLQEQNSRNLTWMAGIQTQLLKFRTYTYSGNMYQAMSKKENCKMYCPGHVFTAKVAAAHTVMRQVSCTEIPLFYYSCKYCGECEHDPKHTFALAAGEDPKPIPCGHTYVMHDLSEKNYIGRNTRGEKVYIMSCCYCGKNENEVNPMNRANEKWGLTEVFADELSVMYFAVKEDDHGAKTSPKAVNETKWAMANQLIDKSVLGTDYLKSINRLQLASLVVRLVEQLIEKEISPASANTFSDTENVYILKAHAAGVMSGKSGNSFAPGETATRQDVAVAIFNALQYVKQNSSIRYTVYTPELDKFSDKSQIAPWALEAMGFTHKLGIIEPSSKTTIEPLKACSIEEAVIAAHRGYYADEIGWYQCDPDVYMEVLWAQPEKRGVFSISTYTAGDRIWVDQPWIGRCRKKIRLEEAMLPFLDEHSGTRVYADGGHFLPIKEL